MKAERVIIYNDRNYVVGQYEVWYKSQVIAHSQDLDILLEKYPDAWVVNHVQ